MRITVIAPGRIRAGYYREGCEDYAARLQRYGSFEMVTVRDEPVVRGVAPVDIKRREAQRIRDRIPAGSRVVAMDERGSSLTTLDLAEMIRLQRDRGGRDLVFVIGGPLGLSPDLLETAATRLSLSAMTLPHELARLVLLEQLYRAFTVLGGEPYHNP